MLLGMDVARLNFSHGSHEDHARIIERLRKVAAELNRSICILQDLQGPKIRTGRLEEHKPVLLKTGSRVTITTRDVPGTALLLATTFQQLPQAVQRGSMILLSDGRLSLTSAFGAGKRHRVRGHRRRHAGRAPGNQFARRSSQRPFAHREGLQRPSLRVEAWRRHGRRFFRAFREGCCRS